jgi:hypothetical protein
MQLIKRLGNKAFPISDNGCNGAGFNCTANITVTKLEATISSTNNDGENTHAGTSMYEALIINHPTGPFKMPDLPSEAVEFGLGLDVVTVTVVFKNSQMPTTVDVRRVDAIHSNALPAYQAAGQHVSLTSAAFARGMARGTLLHLPRHRRWWLPVSLVC